MRSCITKPIAIVGVGLRLPGGVTDLTSLWSVLRDGKDCITTIPSERWDTARFSHPNRTHPGSSVSVAAGVIDHIFDFDADFFGISHKEAAAMDPQQRILLELVWEALENAGITPSSLADSDTAVVVGAASPDSGTMHADDICCTTPYSMTGTNLSIIANRISYIFNFHGPSFTLDTACSSSLYAIYQACMLISHEACSMALACGVNVLLAPYPFVGFSQAYMLSESGRCKVFDASGNGYVRSEGGGVLVLEPLEAAIANGHTIRAVIRAVDCNSDGKTQGIALPSVNAQKSLLTNLYTQAHIDPESVNFIEAHGTGTTVGDPIEALAIGDVLGKKRSSPLALGSIKCNVGHLETASAMAGIMKALVMLETRTIPKQIHIEKLNPAIDFLGLNLHVPLETESLPKSGILRIGVNSFGFGGANGHILLESYTNSDETLDPLDSLAPFVPHLFLQAKSEESLKARAAQIATLLADNPERYPQIAGTLALYRDTMPYRALVSAKSPSDMQESLASFARGETDHITLGQMPEQGVKTAFVFAGNGCHWLGMGRDLLAHPVFFEKVQEVANYFQELSKTNLLEILETASETDLEKTEITQPLIFMIQVGICAVLADTGIVPDLVFGHSVGEVCAVWACGAVSLKDAVRIVYYRSVCQGKTRGSGKMAAAKLSLEQFTALLKEASLDDVELAGINAPNSLTLCGSEEGLLKIKEICTKNRQYFKLLPLDYAFHSKSMESIKDELLTYLSGITTSTPKIPFLSTVGANALTNPLADFGAEYWWNNIRKPVYFYAAATKAIELGVRCFLEISPHAILLQYLRSAMKANGVTGWVFGTMQRKADNCALLQKLWKNCWAHGWKLDMRRFYPTKTQPVSLPNYPWHRTYLRLAETPESLGYIHKSQVHPLLGWQLKDSQSYTSELDLTKYPWLADHKVGNTVFYPAACYLEMVFAAGKAYFGQNSQIEIDNTAIFRPILFDSEHSQTIRFTIERADGEFRIEGRPFMQEGEFRLYSKGRFSKTTYPKIPQIRIEEPKESTSSSILYEKTVQNNMNYGASFQSIECLWRDGSAIFAKFKDPSYASFEQEYGMCIPPALVDGGLQLLFMDLSTSDTKAPRLPYWFDRCLFYKEGRPVYARFLCTQKSTRTITCQIDYLDANGECLLRIIGGRARVAPRLARESLAQSYTSDIVFEKSFVFEDNLALVKKEASKVSENTQTLLLAVCEALIAEAKEKDLSSFPIPLQNAIAKEESHFEELPPFSELWQTLLFDWKSESSLHVLLAAVHATLVDGHKDGQTIDLAPLRKQYCLMHEQEAYPALTSFFKAHFGENAKPKTILLQGVSASPLWKSVPYLSKNHSLWITDSEGYEGNTSAKWSVEGEHIHAQSWNSEEEPFSKTKADAIVFVNTLHNVDDISSAVANIHESLNSQGAFYLLETEPNTVDNILFGTDSSWWVGQNTDENVSRLLPLSAWKMVLESHGFSVLYDTVYPDASIFLFAQKKSETDESTLESLSLTIGFDKNLAQDKYCKRLAEELGDSHIQDLTLLSRASLAQSLLLLKDQSLLIPFTFPKESCDLDDCICATNSIANLAAALDTTLTTIGSAKKACAVFILCEQKNTYANAALVGALRVARNEYPNLSLTILTWDGSFEKASIQALRATLLEKDGEREYILENGVRSCVRSHEIVPKETRNEPCLRLEVDDPGRLESLTWHGCAMPKCGDHDVLIAVAATGLNFRDCMWAQNLLPEEALEQGMSGACLGIECAGTVLSVGQAVTTCVPGDRVCAFSAHAFASHVVTRDSAVCRIPESWTFAEAASVPVTFCTAYYALKYLANIKEHERVLIHGAAGGVGLAALQIAMSLGAQVYATAGSKTKRHILHLLGVQHVYDSRSLAFKEEILEDTNGEGIDCVLNSLAGEAMNAGMSLLRPFGRFLELGKSDFYNDSPLRLHPFRQNIAFFGIDLDQLMRERIDLGEKLFHDVMDGFAKGLWSPLPLTLFTHNFVEQSFRYMQSSKHLGKVVVTQPNHPKPCVDTKEHTDTKTCMPVSQNATYLVTGGLNGFGLASAHFLLAKGAKTLVLLGRKGLCESNRESIAHLREQYSDAQILPCACDVSRYEDLANLFATTLSSLPKLRGIIHAAAILDDATIATVTEDKIRRVLTPKIAGAMHLDTLTQTMALDFFICYSSVTTLVGNPGQINYVAANSVLEALMEKRRKQGLAGLAIGWGAIGDVGMLKRDEKTRKLLTKRTGVDPISSFDALTYMANLPVDTPNPTYIFKADWSVLGHLPLAKDKRFAPLIKNYTVQSEQKTSLLERIANLSEDEAHDVVLTHVIDILAHILRTPPSSIPATKSLQTMGIDSLMAVELGLALEDLLGGKTLPMTLGANVSAESITTQILQMLTGSNSSEDPVLRNLAESHGLVLSGESLTVAKHDH